MKKEIGLITLIALSSCASPPEIIRGIIHEFPKNRIESQYKKRNKIAKDAYKVGQYRMDEGAYEELIFISQLNSMDWYGMSTFKKDQLIIKYAKEADKNKDNIIDLDEL